MRRLQIKVIPNSKQNEIREDNDILIVRTRMPAVEGKANKAVIKLLSEYLSLPQSSIRITHGLRGKMKVVEIDD
jgi:uncharacterized protein